MRRILALGLLASAGGVAAQPAPVAREVQVLAVPGFADFLAVDRAAVWVTNKAGVEKWSRKGKQAEVAMAHPCGAMAISAGSLWVADCKDRTLNRIDLKAAKAVAAIPTGVGNPRGELNVVAGAGSIWLPTTETGTIARIDPATNTVTASISVDPGSFYLAFGFGAVWAVSSKTNMLQRIDPATNTVVKRTALGNQPGFLAAGEGAVWVQEQGDGTVARVAPDSGDVTGRVKVGKDLLYGDIDTGGGRVWLRTTADQAFVVIDPGSLAIVARLGAPAGSGALRHAGKGLWTSAHDVHTLSWWSTAAGGGE